MYLCGGCPTITDTLILFQTKMELPSKQAQIYRLVIEITGLLIVSFPILYIYLFTGGKKEPFNRGFYCNDESLKHPGSN